MHLDVADATGNFNYNLNSLWNSRSPSIVLVTGGLLRTSLMVLI